MNRTQTNRKARDFFIALDYITSMGHISEKEIWKEIQTRSKINSSQGNSFLTNRHVLDRYIKVCDFETSKAFHDSEHYEEVKEDRDLDAEIGKRSRKHEMEDYLKVYSKDFPLSHFIAKELEGKDYTNFQINAYDHLSGMIDGSFFDQAHEDHFDDRDEKRGDRDVALMSQKEYLAPWFGQFLPIASRLARFVDDKYNPSTYYGHSKAELPDHNVFKHIKNENYAPFIGVRDGDGDWNEEVHKFGEKVSVSFSSSEAPSTNCELHVSDWGDDLKIPVNRDWTYCAKNNLAVVEQCFVTKAVLLDAESSGVFKYWKATYWKKSVKDDSTKIWTKIDGYIGRYASDDQAHEPISLRCSPSLSGVKKKIENRTVATGVSALLNGLAS